MKVLDFLNSAKIYYLSTVEGDQPHVRALGFVMDYNGKISFCTDNRKKMYAQMQKNPKVEVCAVDKNLNTLRITGTVEFITTEDSQKKALEVMPDLANLYSVGDGKFEIFCINNPVLKCYEMSGKKVDVELL
ncbi:pyridoxamine 5'-phosphate oxidase family protein [Peptostreptococcus faecalis]|uniref:pyridoxamine 5'-phosphate oxidase family protein n=1 Tax=Peptostreptococcus faecalis TaxID=2045015 RepID=UPI000C7AE632|nr:pyridoxamine 5'-phosphate oxidase family protein [Peptostreptococcus faecalis]